MRKFRGGYRKRKRVPVDWKINYWGQMNDYFNNGGTIQQFILASAPASITGTPVIERFRVERIVGRLLFVPGIGATEYAANAGDSDLITVGVRGGSMPNNTIVTYDPQNQNDASGRWLYINQDTYHWGSSGGSSALTGSVLNQTGPSHVAGVNMYVNIKPRLTLLTENAVCLYVNHTTIQMTGFATKWRLYGFLRTLISRVV